MERVPSVKSPLLSMSFILHAVGQKEYLISRSLRSERKSPSFLHESKFSKFKVSYPSFFNKYALNVSIRTRNSSEKYLLFFLSEIKSKIFIVIYSLNGNNT